MTRKVNAQLNKDTFLDILEGLNNIRLQLEAKVTKVINDEGIVTANYAPIVIENYSKQGAGNRRTTCLIKGKITFGKGEFARTFAYDIPSGWLPARDNSKVGLDEFRGGIVQTSHCNAGDYWQIMASRGSKTPHMEVGAWVMYCIEQLATAGVTSGESSIKVYYLKSILDSVHVDAIEVELLDSKTQIFPYQINLAHVKHLLAWAQWRLDAINRVPNKKDDTVAKSNRLVKINADDVPAEFQL